MTGFIFGGNTPWSYDELQKKRTIAEELVRANMSTPRNVGEGLNAIGRALAFRSLDKKASKRDAELKGEFQSQWDSAFGGFGSGAGAGSPAFAPPSMPAPLPDPNEALAGDAMAALGKPAIHDHGSHPGQSHADWLKYSNQGATRNDPLDPGLVNAMSFLPELGVTMEVFSGGQEPAGTPGGSRTGSTRHDHGKAADAFFYKDGVRLDPNNPAHVPILQEIVKRGKAAGVTGWGAGDGYMQPGSVHLGFGAPAVWGAGGSGANAAPWLVEAYNGAPAGSAPASTGGPASGMDIATLAELAGSPYATPGQKAVLAALMQQQMDAMDPMRAMEMQKMQLELAQLQNPQAEPVDYDTFNGPDGTVYRFNPATGEAEPITGGKDGPRPMTAEERTQWGIPETDKTPYKMTDAGPVAIGGAGTTINNNMDGDKFSEAFAKGDAATVEAVYNSGLAAQRNIGRIDQLEGLLAASPTGFEGAAKLKAGEWGIETEGLDDLQAAQALINSLVPEQRQPGSGPMSDADLALFKQSLPRIINQPGGNQMIVSTMRAIAQYDAEGAAIVQKMRTGELDRAGAFAALQGRKNPLADLALPPPIAGGGADVSDDDAEYLRSLGLEP